MRKSSYLYLRSLKAISSTFTSSRVHFIAYICHIFQIYSLISLGNVLILSEGRPGVDNVFSLADGMQDSRLKEPGRNCDTLGLSCSYPGHLFRRHFETGVG